MSRSVKVLAAAMAAAVLLPLLVVTSGGGTALAERAKPHPGDRRPGGLPRVDGDPLTGSGKVDRRVLTAAELTTRRTPDAPVDETAFAIPADAARPRHRFQGTLTLRDVARSGGFRLVRGCGAPATCGEHLPPFTVDLVQSGSFLIPTTQGLVITGDPQPAYRTYNLIVGPGRAWSERGDRGPAGELTRASLPFALVERNQNCTHNGVLIFLFDDRAVSDVRYQVTAETCRPGAFDMWGQVPASYTPRQIAGARAIARAHAAEVAGRMPTKPLEALATDHPDAGIDLAAFGRGISPDAMSAYGVVYGGVNYVAGASSPNTGCQTRYGTYAYCEQLRLPSYSTAKSAFAGVALALLVDRFGPAAADELLRDHIAEMANNPNWNTAPVTFDHAADMATGNYTNPGFEADEADASTLVFLESEAYESKMRAALNYPHHAGEEGRTWTYHTVDTFLLVQAATGYLRSKGAATTDLFDLVRREVYEPIGLSAGALSTLRTDNLADQRETPPGGRPLGGLGLFLTVDDVAKLATFFQDNGAHQGRQLVDREEMLAAMQRSATDTGVAAVTSDASGTGDGTVAAGGARYSNGLWAFPTTNRLPGCALRTPYMSGYGGITIAMFPNGASYYYFSDGGEFAWANTIRELDKLAPMCAPTKVEVSSDSRRQRHGKAVTFTVTVTSARDARSWSPTGTVQLLADGVPVGAPVALDARGVATVTTSGLAKGRHRVTATYAPDLTLNTGTASSPATTTLTAPCLRGATTCSVASTAGMDVGDTIVMGTPSGTADSHVISTLTPTSTTWVGALQRADHAAGEPVWVQNTAGGGFTASTSRPIRQRIT